MLNQEKSLTSKNPPFHMEVWDTDILNEQLWNLTIIFGSMTLA